MTPKEKAIELVNRYLGVEYVLFKHDGEPFTFPQGRITQGSAKDCAIIAVNEILNNFGTLTEGKQHYSAYCTIEFYNEVKTEIEQL